MRSIELGTITAVIVGCGFKIQHWPGAAILLVCGGCGLALSYFPFGYRSLPAPKATDQILWMTFMTGAVLSVSLVGVVFFLQRWPYSTWLMVSGAVGCAIALVIALVLRCRRARLDIYLDGLMIRCVVIGGLAITLWGLFAGKPR